jgi:hypothetical protein
MGAMLAHVMKRPDLIVCTANNDYALISDVTHKEIARRFKP